MKLLLVLLLAAVALGPSRAAAANDLGAVTAAMTAIRADDVKRHAEVLASDTFEGREAGSRGGQAAGVYLIRQLKKLGVQPAGIDGDYFQHFGNDYRNILAVLPGSDPELRDEYIIVGAHYDHVGYGTRQNSNGPIGRIHNGADDNASGISGLVELIEAFELLPASPKRSLLFAFWDAEEKGLLGSMHWIGNPTVSLEKVRLMVNIDMIGRLRDDSLEVYGCRTAAGLRRLLCEQNRDVDVGLDFTWEMDRNSDHYPFFERRIPILLLHTRKHDDYHRPSDDVDKLNFAGIEKVARLTFRIAYAAADAPGLPEFRPASQNENNTVRGRLRASVPKQPMRLGVSWDQELAAQGVIELTQVRPDSPAQKAGLLVGDRILHIGDYAVGRADFRELVMIARNPVPVQIQRPGQSQPFELSVTLQGGPRRLGIAWREDAAEPGCVILTRVDPGSAADRAGLKPVDRIYAVAGQPFQSSAQFHRFVNEQPAGIPLLVERYGRLRHVTLQPLSKAAETSSQK